jgi:hypothetical protein
MVNTDPAQRPNSQTCLEHQWFSLEHEHLQNLLKINKDIASSMCSPLNSNSSNFSSCNSINMQEILQTPNYFKSIVKANPLAKKDDFRMLFIDSKP